MSRGTVGFSDQFAEATGSAASSFLSQPPQHSLPSARTPVPLQQPESVALAAGMVAAPPEQEEPHAEPQEAFSALAAGMVFAEPQQPEVQAAPPVLRKAAGRTMPGRTVQAIMLLGAEQAEPQVPASTVVAMVWALEPQEEPHAEAQDFSAEAAMVLASPLQEPQQED